MATFMVREIVDGKIIGHPVEAENGEEARKKFAEALPFLKQQAAGAEGKSAPKVEEPPEPKRRKPLKDESLNGKSFMSLEFQCSSCGTLLAAVFKDGYLQVDPCPTCLGELENMVEASKRFLERKK